MNHIFVKHRATNLEWCVVISQCRGNYAQQHQFLCSLMMLYTISMALANHHTPLDVGGTMFDGNVMR